jgi:hypothetical protein
MGAYTAFVIGNIISNKTFCIINAVGGVCIGVSAYFVGLWPQVIMEIFFVSISIWGIIKPPKSKH